MSRRKKRSPRPSTHTKPEERPGKAVASPPPGVPCDPPRPNRWFLAVSILLMAAWVGFLLFLIFAA